MNEEVAPIRDTGKSIDLLAALKAFRLINPDMTVNQMLALVYIWREPGISQIKLADPQHLNLSSGTVARICAVLSERGRRGAEGLGLIEIGRSNEDYRLTVQTLTQSGYDLMSLVLNKITVPDGSFAREVHGEETRCQAGEVGKVEEGHPRG